MFVTTAVCRCVTYKEIWGKQKWGDFKALFQLYRHVPTKCLDANFLGVIRYRMQIYPINLLLNMLHTRKLTWIPKWWFWKGHFLKKWQFLVSMSDFWSVIYVLDAFVSLTIPLDQCMYPGPIQTKSVRNVFCYGKTLGESMLMLHESRR